MGDGRQNRIRPDGAAFDVAITLEPVRRARDEIEGNRVGRLRIVEDFELLAPGFAPRPERLIFGAFDGKLEVDGLQRAWRSVEEDAPPDHRQSRRPPAGEKSHTVEFRQCRCVAEDDGGEVRELWIAEQAGRDAVFSGEVADRSADRVALGTCPFDIGAQAVEIGGQSLSAPDHRPGSWKSAMAKAKDRPRKVSRIPRSPAQ